MVQVDIVKELAKLTASSRNWLYRKGYISYDDHGAIQLTPAGYEYLIKIYTGPVGVR